jgi:hypothetical protein
MCRHLKRNHLSRRHRCVTVAVVVVVVAISPKSFVNPSLFSAASSISRINAICAPLYVLPRASHIHINLHVYSIMYSWCYSDCVCVCVCIEYDEKIILISWKIYLKNVAVVIAFMMILISRHHSHLIQLNRSFRKVHISINWKFSGNVKNCF